MSMRVPTADGNSVLIVTGMSGAGRSTALKVLEDLGYEAVDNLPLSLLSNLVESSLPRLARPLAVGVDARTRDFGIEPFLKELDALIDGHDLTVRVLFLHCDSEVLQRRFTETRRRHPVSPDRPVTDGIRHELRMLEPLRARADDIVDTTQYTPGDLRRILAESYRPGRTPALAIFITSFSYRGGLPRNADLVFDVRFLANPHYDDSLRSLTGLDAQVGAFIEEDPAFREFMTNLQALLGPLLSRFDAEGKSYLTIALGCTGGRHRSVYVCEKLGMWVQQQGWRVSVSHRDKHPLPAPAEPK